MAILLIISSQAKAGIPVIDVAANIQLVTTYIESAIQTIEQTTQTIGQKVQIINEVQMIKNQVDQATRELKHLQKLGATIEQKGKSFLLLKSAANRANALAFSLGLSGAYNTYKNIDDWRSLNDFSSTMRKDVVSRWARNQLETAKSSAQVIDVANDQLEVDRQALEDMQSMYTGAEGALESAQAQGQLLSLQNTQLLQMRTLELNSQQMQVQEHAQKAERDSVIQARQETEKDKFTNYDVNEFQ